MKDNETITVELRKNEAWAIIRAAPHNEDDEMPLEWAANRILTIIAENDPFFRVKPERRTT